METAKTSSLGPRLLWVPEGVQFDELPKPLQAALVDIVNPAYEELVLGAQTALEKGQGLSYVALLFWELLGHFDLGEAWGENLPHGDSKRQRAQLRRCSRLIDLKGRTAKFLLEAQKFYAKCGETDLLDPSPQ